MTLLDSNSNPIAYDGEGYLLNHEELASSNLSTINLATLPVGTYYIFSYIRDRGFTPTAKKQNYTLTLDYDVGVAGDMCIPIKTSNGGLALICL